MSDQKCESFLLQLHAVTTQIIVQKCYHVSLSQADYDAMLWFFPHEGQRRHLGDVVQIAAHSPLEDSRGKSRTCTWEDGWPWSLPGRSYPGCEWWRSAEGRSTAASDSRSPPLRRTRSAPSSSLSRTCYCSRSRPELQITWVYITPLKWRQLEIPHCENDIFAHQPLFFPNDSWFCALLLLAVFPLYLPNLYHNTWACLRSSSGLRVSHELQEDGRACDCCTSITLLTQQHTVSVSTMLFQPEKWPAVAISFLISQIKYIYIYIYQIF